MPIVLIPAAFRGGNEQRREFRMNSRRETIRMIITQKVRG